MLRLHGAWPDPHEVAGPACHPGLVNRSTPQHAQPIRGMFGRLMPPAPCWLQVLHQHHPLPGHRVPVPGPAALVLLPLRAVGPAGPPL